MRIGGGLLDIRRYVASAVETQGNGEFSESGGKILEGISPRGELLKPTRYK